MIENILNDPNRGSIFSRNHLSNEILSKIPADALPNLSMDYYSQGDSIYKKFKAKNLQYRSVYPVLTVDLIREYVHWIDWDNLSKNRSLEDEVLIEFNDKFEWFMVGKQQVLSPNVYANAAEHINWSIVSEYQPLTEDIIDQNINAINWSSLSKNYYLTTQMIIKYWGKLNSYYLFNRFSIDHNWDEYQQKEETSNWFPSPVKIDYDLFINELIKQGLFSNEESKKHFTIARKTPINDDTAAKLLNRIELDHLLENGLLSEQFLRSIALKFNDAQWKIISKHQVLSESFIREYAKSLGWNEIIDNQILSPSFGLSMKSYIVSSESLKRYVMNHEVSSELSAELIGKVDWFTISKYANLSEDFIDTYHNELDWRFLVRYQTLTDELIIKYSEKIRWKLASRHQVLSEPVLRKFASKLHWPRVSQFQSLSEAFINDFGKRLKWNVMSKWQQLPESMIASNADKVNWDAIARFQTLTNEFIESYSDNLNLLHLSRNPNIDVTYINQRREMNSILLEENYDRILLSYALKNIVVSEDFIEDHWSDISAFSDVVFNYQPLSEDFVIKHIEYITESNAGVLFLNNLSEEFVSTFIDSGQLLSWIRINSHSFRGELDQVAHFPESVIVHATTKNESYGLNIGILHILDRIKFSWQHLRYYEDQFRFSQSFTFGYEPEFYEDIIEYYNWNASFKVKDITGFVADYPEYIPWDVVSEQKNLPVTFLRKYKDNVVWDLVCINTKMPLDVIHEFIDKVNLSKLRSTGFYKKNDLKDIEKAKKHYLPTVKIPTTVEDFTEILRHTSRNQSLEDIENTDDGNATNYSDEDEPFTDEVIYSYSLGLLFVEKEMLPFTDITKLTELIGEYGLQNQRAFLNRGTDNEETPPTYFVNSNPQAVQPHQVIEFDWNDVNEYRQVKVHYVYWSTGEPLVGSRIYTGKYEIMVIPKRIPLEYNLILRGGSHTNVTQVESNKIDDHILNKPINELAVSDKLKNQLVISGFNTVGDLMQASEEKIHTIKGISTKNTKQYKELESAMIELGLGLRKPVAYVISSQISTMDIHQVVTESKAVMANEIDWEGFLKYHQQDSLTVVKINSTELKKYKIYDLYSLDGIADIYTFEQQKDQGKVLALLEEYKSQNLIAVPIFIAEA